MSMEPRELLDILAVAERLKDTPRHSYTSKGRVESVAEHSWRLALMAYLLKDELPGADTDKIIKMCLIHDLGEAFTGDIPTFRKTQEDREREDRALNSWVETLPPKIKKEFQALYWEMTRLDTREAKIWKALDKLEALIQHNEADISTWLDLEYGLQAMYGTEECACEPYLKRLRAVVRDDSIKKAEEKKDG